MKTGLNMKMLTAALVATLLLVCSIDARAGGRGAQTPEKKKPDTARETVTAEESSLCELLDGKKQQEAHKIMDGLRRLHTAPGESAGGAITAGRLNASLRVPYPTSARQSRISGFVVLRVSVDEEGKVLEAQAVCGPRQLRKPVEDAVRRVGYTPTLVNGRPVKLSTHLYYRFVIH